MHILKSIYKLGALAFITLLASTSSYAQEDLSPVEEEILKNNISWDAIEKGTIKVDIKSVKNFGLPSMYTNFTGMTKKTDSQESELVEFTSTCDSYLAQILNNSSGSVIQHPKGTHKRSNEILFSPDCKTAYLFPPVNNLLILNGKQSFGSTTEGQCRQIDNKRKILKNVEESLKVVQAKKQEANLTNTAESIAFVERINNIIEPEIQARKNQELINLSELNNARAASVGLTTITGFNSDLIHNYADANQELLQIIPDFQFKLAPIQRGTMFVSDQSEINTEDENINSVRDVLNVSIPGFISGFSESDCSGETCTEEEKNKQSQKLAESLNGNTPFRLILSRAWVCDKFYKSDEGITNRSAKDQTDVISNLTSVTWSYGVAMSTKFKIKATVNLNNLVKGMVNSLRKYEKNWTDKVVHISNADISLKNHTVLEIETPFIGMGAESSEGYKEYLKQYEEQVWNHLNEKVMQQLEELKIFTDVSDVKNVGKAEDLTGTQRFRTEIRQRCKRKWYGSRKCYPVTVNIPYDAETEHSFKIDVDNKIKTNFEVVISKDEVVTYGQNAVFMNRENLDEATQF